MRGSTAPFIGLELDFAYVPSSCTCWKGLVGSRDREGGLRRWLEEDLKIPGCIDKRLDLRSSGPWGNGHSAFVAMNVGSLILLPFSQKYLSLVIVTQKAGHRAPGIVGGWSCTLVSLCRIGNATELLIQLTMALVPTSCWEGEHNSE